LAYGLLPPSSKAEWHSVRKTWLAIAAFEDGGRRP
jgi:hypothetical protein